MAFRWRKVKDDTLLVLSAMAGELEAFDELMCRYRPAVLSVAYKVLGSWDEAEDATQETFLIALKSLPTLQNPTKFGAWLHTIAHHQALRHVNHKQHTQLDEMLLERWNGLNEQDAFMQIERRQRYEELLAAVQNLPEMYQLVIWLHYFEDMPLKRIADFLGVPLTTVKWRLHEAKRMLRKKLS